MTLFTLRFDALGWRSRPMPLAQPIQKHWLSRSGPLTQGLRGLGALELTVLRETIDKPIADERMALALLGAEPVWIREVSMSIDGVPCVVARSVTDLASSRGRWRGIRQLGSRPLADLLYAESSVLRSRFQQTRVQTRVQSHQGLYQALQVANRLRDVPNYSHALLARRSLFVRRGKNLLVSECFLPAFWQLIQQKTTP